MFIGRREDGSIYGCWACQQWEGQEYLPDDHPEVVAFLNSLTPSFDRSNVDNLEKTLKVLALVMRDYCNGLLAGTYTAKTVADLKADFKAKYEALP